MTYLIITNSKTAINFYDHGTYVNVIQSILKNVIVKVNLFHLTFMIKNICCTFQIHPNILKWYRNKLLGCKNTGDIGFLTLSRSSKLYALSKGHNSRTIQQEVRLVPFNSYHEGAGWI